MNSGKKQILWVDDEIEFLRPHIIFLEEHNYDVAKATNGDDAIAMCKSKPFDLIFLDEQMPGKDGLTTVEEIKAFKPDIPVVMVTKSEEEQLMEEAFGRNINSYLTKPVNPSQILSVCKRILHSTTIKRTQITSSYVSEYAEYKARLMTRQNFIDWAEVFQSLCQWDINLTMLKDQGLDKTHNNHKSEVSRKFVKFIESNYLRWHGKRILSTFLITHSYKQAVFPLLKDNKKVCMLIMTGLRMDQWYNIQSFLPQLFSITEGSACALLPSNRLYCRSALFAGKTSLYISLDHPKLWENLTKNENTRLCEKELLKLNLFQNGITNIDEPVIKYISTREDSEDILNHLGDYENEPLLTMVVEFAEMLMNLRKESDLLMEIAPDEIGLRELTRIWFQSSTLLKILHHFSRNNRHVILTSDHGSVLVKNPVEVFCQEEKTPDPRVKVGKGISCDERHVYFIESPAICGLPGKDEEVGYALAKSDHYFTYPNKYQYFGTRFKGQMVSGGLSMEELIVPLVQLSPKRHD